ncbi:helicase [Derxia lacustris]|uniref:helicase n=1 Tax=Derxia lacustris TaxID=764842 RepID=UPI000A174849|nr:helicase [Derxia lacustris]
MLKFKLLLWAFARLLQRQITHNPDCARYVEGKILVFQIRTVSGAGRHYVIRDGAIRSFAGLTAHPEFTLSFSNAAKGFAILTAGESQAAFLRGLGNKELTISGNFQEVMWFQGLTAFLQPPKVVAPCDRIAL